MSQSAVQVVREYDKNEVRGEDKWHWSAALRGCTIAHDKNEVREDKWHWSAAQRGCT